MDQRLQYPIRSDSNGTGQLLPFRDTPGSKEFGRIFNDLLSSTEPGGTHTDDLNKQDSGSTSKIISRFEARLNQTADALKHAQEQAKVKAAVKRIAGFLGVSEGFLLMVLDSLGIQPEDLIDQARAGEIARKLSEYFGFDEEKKKEFELFLNKTCEAIEAGYY